MTEGTISFDHRPWLKWYGLVPATLDYPETTLYGAIDSVCRRIPNAIAWDFFDTTSTYGEFKRDIEICANALAALGLKAHDRILISMPTSPQAVIAFYAANKLGAVAAFVHPLSTSSELEHYLNASGARIALTLDMFYERFASLSPKVKLETLILARIDDYLPPLKKIAFWAAKGHKIKRVPASSSVRWWLPFMRAKHSAAPESSTGTKDPAAILFSGGTTGTPKGIVLSSYNFIAEGMGATAWSQISGGQSILAILPIFHGFGLGVCVNAAFMSGGKSILVPTFDPKIVADVIRKKRPNILVGVPTLFAALMNCKALSKVDLSCLRAVFSGADKLPCPLKEQFERFVAERGGSVKLLEGYGLTESVTAVMAMPLNEYREGSIGVPFPDMTAKICKIGTEEELPHGEDGEICISGPAVMLGYLDDPETTAQTLRVHTDGQTWLHTGDAGTMDSDGFFYFKERYKRLIKSSGFNVFPGQVEAVLYKHPLVSKACVIGVPDSLQIERVKAYIVLKDGAQADKETEQLLIEHCRLQLLKWSCPREIEFRDDLPVTKVGKIDYKVLLQEHIAKTESNTVQEARTTHGGDRVASALDAHGVRFLFTVCGGHISPILTGAKARGIRVIDVRDEATAVFAADAIARLTGVPGVAAVTAGPGLTNALTALQNAQLAQSPVILMGGAAPTALQGRGALQDIDQHRIVAPHVKAVKRVRSVRNIVPAIEDAFKAACQGVPGPVFIELPIDVLYDETRVRQSYAGGAGKSKSLSDRLLRLYLDRHVNSIFAGIEDIQPQKRSVSLLEPTDSSVQAAAAALSRSQKPVLIVGSQTLADAQAAPRVASAISRLGVPVYLSGMGRGLLGRRHDLQMYHQRRQALKDSDCVVQVGVPSDFRLDYGRNVRRSSTLIVANRSSKDATMNRRADITALGDAGLFLERLSARLGEPDNRWKSWVEELRRRDDAREADIDERSKVEGEHVNPIALLRAVDRIAGDNAVFVADGGDFVATASYILRPRSPLSWLDPGVFGTLGVGAGFALGAALCCPNAEIWILYGDGACGYSLIEFDTFVRHGIPVIAVVGNDAGWSQIARDQVDIFNDDVATVLARTDYHKVAEGFGARGILVKEPGEIESALTSARESGQQGQPVLINVWLDRTDFRKGSISM